MAYEIIQRFVRLVTQHKAGQLETWLAQAEDSGIGSFKGLHRASGETVRLFSRPFRPTTAMGRWKGKPIASNPSSVKDMVERC